MNTSPEQLGLDIEEHNPRKYNSALMDAARAQALKAARVGDPVGYERAIEAIRELALSGVVFDADDVRSRVVVASSSVGAAFNAMSKAGEIEAVGYAVSRSPSRHSGLLRRWRGV